MKGKQLFDKLREAVIAGDRDAVVKISKEIIKQKLDPLQAIEEGLSKGAIAVGNKFEKLEIFLTDLMMAADAMKAGLDTLLPHIPKGAVPKKATVVSGTVQGDIHDIGKNVLVALLRANGFEVQDLGVDIHPSKFIEEADRFGADIITLSALMASTLGAQKDVIDYLEATGKRKKFIVMVGGGPTTREWADRIGADGYAETATEAVKIASKLIQKKRRA